MGYFTCVKGRPQKLSEHFTSAEFDCHGRGCCSSTRVSETLLGYLEQIRTHFNAPITITSGYRCPVHNGNVGGATKSRHASGDAADIVVKGVLPRIVAQYAESIGVPGIGLYETDDDGHFVHIDDRPYKSFWYGQAQIPRTTFGAYTGSSVVVIPNAPTTNTGFTIIDRGDKGTAVKELQEKLIRLGYSCGVFGADGSFGQQTLLAVKAFQGDSGLNPDGIVGYLTSTALDKAIEELGETVGGKKVKITASVLNVRAGAGTTNRIIGTLRKNTVCVVLEEKGGWGRIGTPAGWISSQYYTEI